MFLETFIGCIVVGAGWYFYKENKKESKEQSPVVSNAIPFPCVIEGGVDSPPMDDKIKALAFEAETKGIVVTGDYATDVANQSGEMILIGTGFKFVFDANGQIEKDKSKLNLFLVDYGVEGGMNLDGTLGMDVVVGAARVQVQGKVENGKFVNGKVVKTWLFKQGHPPHIYGVLNGTYRKV